MSGILTTNTKQPNDRKSESTIKINDNHNHNHSKNNNNNNDNEIERFQGPISFSFHGIVAAPSYGNNYTGFEGESCVLP